MPRRREALVVVAVLAVVVLGGVVMIVGGMTGSGHPASAVGARSPAGVVAAAGASAESDRQAGGAALCNSQRLAVDGGVYTVQNNEWGSGAVECLAAGGPGGFTVTRSAIANSTSGAPGGYPSIYRGCHWGACTPHSGLPVPVSRLLSPGTVTTTWATAQPRTGAYDVAYDIWFNRAPSTSGQPDGAELMIWLNHNGPVQPFGSQVSTAAIGGRSYDVWFGKQAWNTITYSMVTGTTSVRDLDIGQFAADALRRGYIQKSWYLADVEAGFELWQGGAGLATDSFAVNVPGGSSAPIAAGAAGATAAGATAGRRPGAEFSPSGRQRLLHRHVLGCAHLAGRSPGTGAADQHEHQPSQRVDPDLVLYWRSAGHRPVERRLYPVGRAGAGDQCVLRRNHRPVRVGNHRVHRQQHRERRAACRIPAQRYRLPDVRHRGALRLRNHHGIRSSKRPE